MPSFKPKGSKTLKVCKKQGTTLDGKHKSILEEISKEERSSIPQWRAQRKKLLKLRNNTSSAEKTLDYNERISKLNGLIRRTKAARLNYWKSNSDAIFAYYEARTQEGETKKRPVVLENFFGIEPLPRSEDTGGRRMSNVKKFLSKQDQAFIRIEDYTVSTDRCTVCGKGELIPVEHEGLLVCNMCSAGTSILIENERPSYKEPPKEVCFYAYKRINHFREILAQFQAKETTQIPDAVLMSIQQQIKKERITAQHLTNRRAKELLKKLGYNKYYEHIPFIKDKLGIRPPIMSQALEERLCNLFMEIQAPYAKYCPIDRVNFLNYYYTVYKLCELLDCNEFLPYFPMLKDREKRIEQDEIWKKICFELNWEFVPTV